MSNEGLDERLIERLRQLEKGFATLAGVKITGITAAAIRAQLVCVLGAAAGQHVPKPAWLGKDLLKLSRIFPDNIHFRRMDSLTEWDLFIPLDGFNVPQAETASKPAAVQGLLQSVTQLHDGTAEVAVRVKWVDVLPLCARMKTMPPMNIELRELSEES